MQPIRIRLFLLVFSGFISLCLRLPAQNPSHFTKCIRKATQHSGCRIGEYHKHPNGICGKGYETISFIVERDTLNGVLQIDSIRSEGWTIHVKTGRGGPNKRFPKRQLIALSPYAQYQYTVPDSTQPVVKGPDLIWYRIDGDEKVEEVTFEYQSHFQAPPPSSPRR